MHSYLKIYANHWKLVEITYEAHLYFIVCEGPEFINCRLIAECVLELRMFFADVYILIFLNIIYV
jgi:hypothetical protein